jgi:hypothetical protein
MDLNRPVPWAPGNGVAADAAQSSDQLPATEDAKTQSAEVPSFAPLLQPARTRRWSAAQLLVLACAFAGGVGVGVGGTYLIHADRPLTAFLQTIQRTQAPVEKLASAGGIGVQGSPFPAETPSVLPRPTVGGVSSDASQTRSRTDNAETSAEVSALKEQLERQLAEGRLDKPENNNALDTYRKMAAIAPNDPATIALGGHLSASFWSLANRARTDARLDEALHYYGILKTLPPVPLAAILGKQSPEPSAAERDASPGAGPPVTSLPEAAAALQRPVISSEAAEPTKPPEVTPAAPIVMSAPAASVPSPSQAIAPIAAPSPEPTNPRDVANAAPIMSSPPNAAPLRETAPTASIAGRTAAVDVGNAAAPSSPAEKQTPEQNASSEAAASREAANAGPVAKPTPAVGANSAASPAPVREERPGEGTPTGAAASQVVANAGPIIPSPSAAPSPEGASAIIGIAMARGDEALAAGDVISARQFYELAATNGLAHAATAVGQTYDPNFLQAKGVRGTFADAQTAERWYQKAIDGGDAEARMRLDKLLKADQGKLVR